ncbi:MAG: MFS transporter [Clostridia bacterium]|nr:MFS transporter [Clostridia bacterium]
MKKLYKTITEMKTFLELWSTQMLSGLGSAMTSYALTIWTYSKYGSALVTALLMVSSYAPYVLMSIFAGVFTDRWNKKVTMLVCDSVAALSTAVVLLLIKTNSLQIWHIYIINAVNGLMNTVQQPASEVAVTKILPEQYYQKVGGLRYLSSSLNSILTPIIATAVLGLWGIESVIYIDLLTFLAAFLTLLLLIKIPENDNAEKREEKFISAVKNGIGWLKREKGVMTLIMFLAAINLIASMYSAAFPAMMLSKANEKTMGMVNAVIGIATLAGSVMASFIKAPKSRVRVICNCLLFSMSTENIMLALGNSGAVWALAGFLGWIFIPLMNANMDVILRIRIPVEMQGRVYAVRNSFQFFTIPVGYFLGGAAVDCIFEPFMAAQNGNALNTLFGSGKGSGAALFFFVIAFAGVLVCIHFRRKKCLWELDKKKEKQ